MAMAAAVAVDGGVNASARDHPSVHSEGRDRCDRQREREARPGWNAFASLGRATSSPGRVEASGMHRRANSSGIAAG